MSTPLVHGMGKQLVTPFWPPITDDEARVVLARYPCGMASGGRVRVAWLSPRPLSAAAIVAVGDERVFVKRHHHSVRSPAQLHIEHAFATHLRHRGQPVPGVLRTVDGGTVVTEGSAVYEVQEVAPGLDAFVDALSWSPFPSLGHAYAAGRALARFHLASEGFAHPARPPAVLTGSVAIITSDDPVTALGHLRRRRPALDHALSGRPIETDLDRHHLVAIGRARPLARQLPPLWGHGDWHASNLTWALTGTESSVAGIFDLGLANRTFAAHDVALALERNTIDWLDLAARGRTEADVDAVDAILDGYEALLPLGRTAAAAVAEVLPVCHLEYALSELEYFSAIARSPAEADLAYRYLVDHSAWFEDGAGAGLLEHLRRRSGRRV